MDKTNWIKELREHLKKDTHFLPNPKFVCMECGSKEGTWMYDKSASGIAIICDECEHITGVYRHWKTELDSHYQAKTHEEWVENYETELHPPHVVEWLIQSLQGSAKNE